MQDKEVSPPIAAPEDRSLPTPQDEVIPFKDQPPDYRAGWEARIRDEPFQFQASADWQRGWRGRKKLERLSGAFIPQVYARDIPKPLSFKHQSRPYQMGWEACAMDKPMDCNNADWVRGWKACHQARLEVIRGLERVTINQSKSLVPSLNVDE